MFESTVESAAATDRWLPPSPRTRPAPNAVADGSWSSCAPSGLLFDALTSLAPAELTDAQVLEASVAMSRVVAAAQAAQLRLLARFARLRPAEQAGGRQFSEFAADEIAPALRISRNAALTQLSLATQLENRLPRTLAALGRGEIDLSRARVLCDVTSTARPEHAAAVEDRVLGRASVQTAPQLRQAARRALISVDPDGAARRHQTQRRLRSVQFLPCDDGMAELRAYLPAFDATAIYQRLGAIARQAKVPGETRTADQRRADAFIDLLLSSTSGGSTQVTTQVQVTVAASTLRGADQRSGDLAGYGPVPAPVARELASAGDVSWRRILTHPVTGALLDYGRTTYRPPAALADHVRARDVTCRFPGCRHPARTCDLDHSVPFPVGPTAASNLGSLCRHHHRLKHETRWTVVQRDRGEFCWTSPTGRRYLTAPEALAPPAKAIVASAAHCNRDERRAAVLRIDGEHPPCVVNGGDPPF